MDTQPYCLHSGWIKSADTGKPIARLDHNPLGEPILVIPHHGAITLDNLVHLVDQIQQALLLGPTGCHRAGQNILMFDGSVKPVERVAVGDRIMGPDGAARTVTD